MRMHVLAFLNGRVATRPFRDRARFCMHVSTVTFSLKSEIRFPDFTTCSLPMAGLEPGHREVARDFRGKRRRFNLAVNYAVASRNVIV